MTSRRKAKRQDWVEIKENMFVLNDDGSQRPMGWSRKWYEKRNPDPWVKHPSQLADPDAMWGCVKKSKQQKHRGSWNGIRIDPWYRMGLISWKRD